MYRLNSDFLKPVDREGKVLDFHSLRHTFISRMVRAGVNPKDAQTLARHSVITLTMDRYAHVDRKDVAAALSMVPSLPSAGYAAGPKLAQIRASNGHREIVGESAAKESTTREDQPQTLKKTAVERTGEPLKAEGKGFEPLIGTGPISVFKTDAFDRSATPPMS